MLSMRWNRFPECSACNEISSPYAQCAIKFVPRMLSMDCTCKNVHILPLAEHARKFVPRMLSMQWNQLSVCSACNEIVSAYAQHAHAIIFENDSKIPNLNANFAYKKSKKNLSDRTKVKILKKKNFWISLKKNLVPRMLSHRGNVRTSKFWQKLKEKKRNFLGKIYEGHIRIWFRSKKIQNYLMLVYL